MKEYKLLNAGETAKLLSGLSDVAVLIHRNVRDVIPLSERTVNIFAL